MAVYKIIQDIEAEDKLVGPFALRQFIYVLIVAASLFIGFKLGEVAWWLSLIVLPHTVFFALLAAPLGQGQPTEVWLLAKFRFAIKPRKHVWQQEAAHQLVTITAPKKVEKRLTKDISPNQVHSRLQNLASTLDSHGWSSKHIAADPFSGASMSYGSAVQQSDRLVQVTPGSPQQSQAYNLPAESDMLDELSNPTAKKLDKMINASSRARRLEIMKKMKEDPQQTTTVNSHLKTIEPLHKSPKKNLPITQAAEDSQPKKPGIVLPPALGVAIQPPPPPPPPTPQQQAGQAAYNQPAPARSAPAPPLPRPNSQGPVPPAGGPVVAPDPEAVAKQWEDRTQQPEESRPLTEQELLEKIHNEQQQPKNYGHMRVVHPLGEGPPPGAAMQQQNPAPPQGPYQPQMQPQAQNYNAPPQTEQPPRQPDRDIIELANNDDLNVETLARQANKNRAKKTAKGEVVINLHDDDE